MKIVPLMTAAVIVLATAGGASWQAGGAPSGRGSVTGDPAASSTAPNSDPRGTTGMSPGSRSGSGTSTSGGKDDNGDQGRDKMPDSNMDVRPQSDQPQKPH